MGGIGFIISVLAKEKIRVRRKDDIPLPMTGLQLPRLTLCCQTNEYCPVLTENLAWNANACLVLACQPNI